jgi:predicted glycogen debranching enzyme
MNTGLEWLETDGLGGFASGTAGLVRTRRYHALLMRALTPSRRFVLVNGFDAFITTPDGRFALSAQRYRSSVTAPDGIARLESFSTTPWPTWLFRLPCGRAVRQEIFIPHGRAATVLTFTLEGHGVGCSLEVRPFFSGRDPHALQRENPGFNFEPVRSRRTLLWSAYADVPPVALNTNATYRHEPHWYRQFLYEAERARGLDDTEDLAAPGVFTWDFAEPEAAFIFASPTSHEDYNGFHLDPAVAVAAHYRFLEQRRRAAFTDPLHRAAADYLVRRGQGHTIVAGYPWFTDWGRDTFIALRGLCLATGRLDEARSILIEWAGVVSEGMLPNFFPDGAQQPEYNSVDASLWYIVAVHDYLDAAAASGRKVPAAERDRLAAAVAAILDGYSRGTRFGIRADTDGLLFAGQPGVQLTWMDAKVGDWVVTPRIGKPVEIQALWINALCVGARFNAKWNRLAALARESFSRKFWNERRGCLYDVIDVDGDAGSNDASLRPNQIFAVGGLPFAVLTGSFSARVVQVVEQHLLTPLGLRSLAPDDPAYQPHYRGGPRERDGAYHQGTVWPWLIGPFVEAWLRTREPSPENRRLASERFLAPLREHLATAGLGHISEVADASAPHTPGGCPFQAWSLGEMLRVEALLQEPEGINHPDAKRVRPAKTATPVVISVNQPTLPHVWSAHFAISSSAPDYYRL